MGTRIPPMAFEFFRCPQCGYEVEQWWDDCGQGLLGGCSVELSPLLLSRCTRCHEISLYYKGRRVFPPSTPQDPLPRFIVEAEARRKQAELGEDDTNPTASANTVATPPATIRLASGGELRNPSACLRKYLDARYDLYDGVDFSTNSKLHPEEMAISIMVNSRISGNTAQAIWEQRESVEDWLQHIPQTAAITDEDTAIPWEAVRETIGAFCRIPGVGLAVATKILHKKRPALIPIMDLVVREYYGLSWRGMRQDDGNYAVALMKAFRGDLMASLEEIRALVAETESIGKPLTECRLLELIIWIMRAPNDEYRRV